MFGKCNFPEKSSRYADDFVNNDLSCSILNLRGQGEIFGTFNCSTYEGMSGGPVIDYTDH